MPNRIRELAASGHYAIKSYGNGVYGVLHIKWRRSYIMEFPV